MNGNHGDESGESHFISQGGFQQPFRGTCWECNQPGHKGRFCPELVNWEQNQKPSQPINYEQYGVALPNCGETNTDDDTNELKHGSAKLRPSPNYEEMHQNEGSVVANPLILPSSNNSPTIPSNMGVVSVNHGKQSDEGRTPLKW